ncbi:chloroplastic group IIA intron splicing facilitator CRS1, chloroplastic isoform X2 [Malania oleifera]|uniref:chloroplastic group IIA intron splicing facilitator CRS1, chloroplastic isoform X2 n=1 Tax=Malania oleifera TaxID=397392 RepID=UPI0025AE193C|nr:chloroplastic group IIA intron splicing facilitator CRS1, chloroplastic isoform X2 [Malania oleifera]
MSATALLFPPPPPPSAPSLFLSRFYPFSYSCISISSSLNPKKPPINIKPNLSSKPPKSFPVHSTSTTTTVTTTTTKNLDFSVSSEPICSCDTAIKMPTAPWMKGPLILQPDEVLDLSKSRKRKSSGGSGSEKADRALTDKVSGVRGRKAMKKIVQSIAKLKEKHDCEQSQKSSGEFEFVYSLEGQTGGAMPWSRGEKIVFWRMKKEKVVTAAELTLDRMLLERLRGEARRMRKWLKVKKAGVTQSVVDQIRFAWKESELAMLKFYLPLCRNMDRAREIVEIKTGGLVVWTKKDALVVYRGCSYQSASSASMDLRVGFSGVEKASYSKMGLQMLGDNVSVSLIKSNGSTANGKMSIKDVEEETPSTGISMEYSIGFQPVSGTLYEREADRLLDDLGPRFIDWWRPKPLPVDADLLPEVVPGLKTPFRRLCPPHARSKLTDNELTYLRKLAHSLPTHFVLGKNQKLHGLAAAILKLWEKCHIVKIAVKLGIPNTNNKLMACELKHLTGGVLLLRNKFYIILYRGKDFLPCGIANVVADREMELKRCQFHEEAARLNGIKSFCRTNEVLTNSSITGTLSEFEEIQREYGDFRNGNWEVEVQVRAEKERLKNELRKQERKLFILKKKIEKSAKELWKLNSAWRPAEQDSDQELITDEERECFRQMGLKMESCLVLGRRGVFDGVIEGIYQHWKHREIVKVVTMQRRFSRVIYTARSLESESEGILVSVEKLKEGHAIIIYRGKNYRRPLKLASRNLLTKKSALRRSLEVQRIGSLKFFAYQRERIISDLKQKLTDLQKSRVLHHGEP